MMPVTIPERSRSPIPISSRSILATGRNPDRDHFGEISTGPRTLDNIAGNRVPLEVEEPHIAHEKVVHAKAQRSPATPIRDGSGAETDRSQLFGRTWHGLRVSETRPGGGGHLAAARRLG